MSNTSCSCGKRLQFLIHDENNIELLTRDSEWPCEHKANWFAEWRAGKRHYLFICEEHAAEKGLDW